MIGDRLDTGSFCMTKRIASLSCVAFYLISTLLAGAEQPVPSRQSASSAQHAQDMAEGLKLFKQRVRPLLTKHCLVCHGDSQKLGGFDLSNREALIDSGNLGENAASSLLIKLLRHEEEPHMPFKQAKLSDKDIDEVSRWIDLGVPYDQPLVSSTTQDRIETTSLPKSKNRQSSFWSFLPLEQTALPSASDSLWNANPIDQFIHQELTSQSLQPNSIADRATLARRAYLNLLGLPPEPEKIDAFVQDPSPDAYERLIDDLLDSSHYGERWARHWMDIARFAESDGFEQDWHRHAAYHYRDFLIRAFNSDMPYDQFVRWQIAGDELAPENPQAMMATGFLGAGPFPSQIPETEFETTRYGELDDMVGTMGTATLGLTIGCARCHDHKYDPISSQEYYRLVSIFGRTIRTEIDYTPNHEDYLKEKQEWQQQYEALKTLRDNHDKHLAEPFSKWLTRLEKGENDFATDLSWQVLDIISHKSEVVRDSVDSAIFEKLEDGSLLATGPNPRFTTYTFTAETLATDITSIRLEALTHPSLFGKGPGRSHSGQFNLNQVDVEIQPMQVGEVGPFKAELVAGTATGEKTVVTYDETYLVNRIEWLLKPSETGVDQAAVFTFDKPIGFEGGTRLIVTMSFRVNTQFTIGRPRLSISSKSRPEVTVRDGIPQDVVEGLGALKKEGLNAISKKQKGALFEWFVRSKKSRQDHNEKLRLHLNVKPRSPKTRMQVTVEGLPTLPHPAEEQAGFSYPHYYPATYFLNRGDVAQKGDVARPGYVQVLMRSGFDEKRWRIDPPIEHNRSRFDRASLSNWITDVDNGAGALLARVIVNRVWHHHFGRGIVATPNDFGMQGDRPTHPQLLDWLARDLIIHDWRLKRLHKMIMMSRTYQLSNRYDATNASLDLNNIYRWRWTPRRLEAEAIRDSLLSVSKLLDTTMYGPGSLRTDMRRRSIYFFIKRGMPIPSMMLFDWPEHLVGIGHRPSTTIAPQALMFLNSPQARRYAEGLASRLQDRVGAEAIHEAYRITYGRKPTNMEVVEGEKFINQQQQLHKSGNSSNYIRSALVDYCQSLLSLNEFLYIR